MVQCLGINFRFSDWPKPWQGEPTAVLIKATAGLLQPCKRVIVTNPTAGSYTTGIPEPIRARCAELMESWSRGDPKILKTAEQAPPAKDKGPKDRGNWPVKHHRGGRGGTRGDRDRSGRDKQPPQRRERSLRPSKRTHSEISHERSHACQPEEPFVLGPDVSVNDMINKTLWGRGERRCWAIMARIDDAVIFSVCVPCSTLRAHLFSDRKRKEWHLAPPYS
jgi:hypothetical protein